MKTLGFLMKIGFCFWILTLAACGGVLDSGSPRIRTGELQKPEAFIDFQVLKSRIFEPKCSSCHANYTNYDSVRAEIVAIESSILGNRMPKNSLPLSSEEKRLLQTWLQNGRPENQELPAEPLLPNVLEPTWDSLSVNVIFPKCLVCHNPNGQARFLDLSSRMSIYSARNRVFGDGKKLIDLDSPENSYFVDVLLDEEEPMPPVWSNLEPLSSEEISVLTAWISQGLP